MLHEGISQIYAYTFWQSLKGEGKEFIKEREGKKLSGFPELHWGGGGVEREL